jgi:hypothetical protein
VSRKMVVLVASCLLPLAASFAMAFESPPTAQAEDIFGSEASGPNYRVEPLVRSDGLLHIFVLNTAFGSYQIAGDDLMRERIRELAALRKLQAMSESDVFVKSLGQAAVAPIRYGADLLTDPKATLQKSFSGVANMFDRIGAGLTNSGASRDSVVASVLGVDEARRTLAVQLGVDPYTDFPPLASKLSDVASAAALGGLSTKGLLVAIPGGVGTAVSSASTADTLGGTLAQKTSAQIVGLVKGQLLKLRVPANVADRFVQNRTYTPADLLIISQALRRMRAGNAALFIARAADAGTREEAFFQRRRAQILADNAKALGIGEFVSVAGFPLNRSRDGGIVAVFPFDQVAWTENVAWSFEAVAKSVSGQPRPPVLAVTGKLTDEAQANVTRLGWTIHPLQDACEKRC